MAEEKNGATGDPNIDQFIDMRHQSFWHKFYFAYNYRRRLHQPVLSSLDAAWVFAKSE